MPKDNQTGRLRHVRPAGVVPVVAMLLAFIVQPAFLRFLGAQEVTSPSQFPVETGVRLRIFQLDGAPDPARPLDPSQSPNSDSTIGGFQIPSPAIAAGPGNAAVDRQFIALLSGWFHVGSPGACVLRVQASGPCRIALDEAGAHETLSPTGPHLIKRDLNAGWHSFEITCYVNGPDESQLAVDWQRPGQDGFEPIPASALRAPSFYFRPTQPGFKRQAGVGDRPGLGEKLAGLHPGYRVTDIRPGNFEMPVGGLALLPDGRLVVARFEARTLKAPRPALDPNGQLWLIHHPDSDNHAEIRGELIADGLREPSGVCVVGESIYVSHRDSVLRFDLDQATGTWHPVVVASGWETNDFHQISAGLLHEPGPTPGHPGFLIMARSPGLGLMQNPPDHGSVWRIDLSRPPRNNVTVLTGGHRTPNGLGFGPRGEIFVIDNQGEWTPANELNHVQQGKFYGFFQPDKPPCAHASPFQPPGGPDDPNAEITGPAVQLPQDEIGNSPTQPLMFPDGHRFAGQLALPDMRYGGINRVYLEEVAGVWQGCAMRFTQGLAAGPNRIAFGPDGAIYVGGIGGHHASTWYWNNPAGEPTFQSLERLTPTGEDVFDLESMAIVPGGFEVRFTESVPQSFLEDPAQFQLRAWRYHSTPEYGGPKLDEHELEITAANASPDRRSVRLSVDGLEPGWVIHLRTDPVSDAGHAIWSGEAWYTVNRLPLD